jgi:hypothetical protein
VLQRRLEQWETLAHPVRDETESLHKTQERDAVKPQYINDTDDDTKDVENVCRSKGTKDCKSGCTLENAARYHAEHTKEINLCSPIT